MKDWFIGLTDIILIILALIVVFLGFRKGFMKKALGIVGIIAIVIFAILYAGQFADWLTNIGMPPSKTIYNNVYSKASVTFPEGATGQEIFVQVFGGFIGNVVYFLIGKPQLTTNQFAEFAATNMTHFVMTIIAFFVIVIGVLLIIGILKLIANLLRESKLIKVIDGILGAILSLAIFAVLVSVVLMIFRLVIENQSSIDGGFLRWFCDDLHLDDNSFRITKALYNHNFVYNLVHMFF